MRALWMELKKKKKLFDVDDTFMVGDTLMVKPITSPGILKDRPNPILLSFILVSDIGEVVSIDEGDIFGKRAKESDERGGRASKEAFSRCETRKVPEKIGKGFASANVPKGSCS